jgi:hypothetical protein
VRRVDSRRRGANAGPPGQVTDIADLVVGHQGDDHPIGAGPSGSPGAMQVRLVLDRRVGVDDDPNVVHMDAAGRDVGCHQGRCGATVEPVHVPRSGVLAEVAVQLDRRHPRGVQQLG